MSYRRYSDPAALAEALAGYVADTLAKAIAVRGRAFLAVPGGSTPRPFLSALGARQLDWSKVAVTPTDERWAPPDHPRSNERMIGETFFAAGASPTFLSYWREGMAPADAAAEVAGALIPHLPFDIVVLGMGADMHCASLFPQGDGLAEAMEDGAPAAAAITAPGAPEPRITLTADPLAEAGRTILLITGMEKLEAYARAIREPNPLAAPIGHVLRRARRAEVHWAP